MICTLILTRSASANLVQNGNFTGVTYSGTKPVTTLFGQFGSYSGSQLTVSNWATSGYNFVYAPGTADSGTKANGANTGQPNQAPGAYTAANGYGNTYLWGVNNGGVATITAVPTGGNFIAADGDFGVGAISQTISGLTVGTKYHLSFYWAGAQQQGFDGATTESWKVTFGSQTFTTATVSTPNHGFTGWMLQTFDFTATSATQTLSFLAQGAPTGQPPFALLGGVNLDVFVPEFSHWAVFAGFGVACTFGEALRRQRRQHRNSAVEAPVPVSR